MTPYAVLLVRPTDTDAVVRKVYHALARANHYIFGWCKQYIALG